MTTTRPELHEGIVPSPSSVPDLADALVRLGAAPAGDVEVVVEGAASAPLREFLRAFGRPTGGWLNRSWSLPPEAAPALAHVARASGGGSATIVRTSDGERAAPARLWITLTSDRRAPLASA